MERFLPYTKLKGKPYTAKKGVVKAEKSKKEE